MTTIDVTTMVAIKMPMESWRCFLEIIIPILWKDQECTPLTRFKVWDRGFREDNSCVWHKIQKAVSPTTIQKNVRLDTVVTTSEICRDEDFSGQSCCFCKLQNVRYQATSGKTETPKIGRIHDLQDPTVKVRGLPPVDAIFGAA